MSRASLSACLVGCLVLGAVDLGLINFWAAPRALAPPGAQPGSARPAAIGPGRPPQVAHLRQPGPGTRAPHAGQQAELAPATQGTDTRRPPGLTLHFGTNSPAVRPQDRQRLKKLADQVRAHPALKVQISGHADRSGREDFNDKLSAARASAVTQALVDAGVAAARLTSRGFGSSQPLPGSEKREYWYRNRRVEVRVE
jgi:outer membrane protein OmpA-like peptidoglycan-associated protein